MSASLAGDAPAFVPGNNAHQSGGPGSGSSSPPGDGPTNGESSNGNSTGIGHSSGSADNISSGNANSSNSNGQSFDRYEPVIVTTLHAGPKVRQTTSPQRPSPGVTRFLRVDNIYAAHFEEGKPLGYVKGLVSTLQPGPRKHD